MTSNQATPENPLAGITVLEFGQFIAGPYASQIMADLGARVIKIERPGTGDPFRLYVTEPRIEGYGHNYLAFNRNKESVVVDVQRPEGVAIVKKLVAKADVLIENFRAGVLERLGLGYEALRQVNPKLIYCAISGFSEDGPYKNRPAFDTVGQALSGMLYLFTDPKDPRMRGPTIADQATAMQASNAVLGALYGREKSGQGSKIEIAMIEAAIHFMPDAFTALTESGIDMKSETRTSYSHAFVLECADGKCLAIHVGGPDKLWQALCAAVDDPSIGAEPLFQKRHSRIANYDKLINAMRPVFKRRSRAEWLKRLADHDVASAELNTIGEAVGDVEVAHLGLFEKQQREGYGDMTMLRRAPRINGAREPRQKMPPLLGEHTQAVLKELGYDDAAVAKLKEAKVI
ncbi:MAG TPA: CaiB/BaiF CoA-transferase family protein [Stellaceae bacterium]|nr:CaiB/BaiF CoA-transferase family protein [Stellaceae bacterium]